MPFCALFDLSQPVHCLVYCFFVLKMTDLTGRLQALLSDPASTAA